MSTKELPDERIVVDRSMFNAWRTMQWKLFGKQSLAFCRRAETEAEERQIRAPATPDAYMTFSAQIASLQSWCFAFLNWPRLRHLR